MSKIQGVYKVVSNDNLCKRFKRLVFDAPNIVKSVKPGQFVHIRTSDGFEPFFRRPFSVYQAKKYVEVFYEIVGPGTQLMGAMKKGDDIDVIGAVGSTFTIPTKKTKQVVMVAGGIGVAPFAMFADVLRKKNKDVEMILLYGGRTKEHVYPMKEFKANGVKVHVATDDGSVGVKGRVSKLFDKIDFNEEATRIYTCGPHPMMHAVQTLAKEHNLKGEAACEEVMACALGACLGCAIETTEGYKTVCYDGPVFDLQTIVF
ncbi:MAG: dihydroorotate dehydrogenase electron transfer subunit [Lysobacterales bacterium]|jgi:dihydroorotate dehydrogenase electron transfer subunit